MFATNNPVRERLHNDCFLLFWLHLSILSLKYNSDHEVIVQDQGHFLSYFQGHSSMQLVLVLFFSDLEQSKLLPLKVKKMPMVLLKT